MISIDEHAEWFPHGRGVTIRHPKFESGNDDYRIGVCGVSLLEDDTGPGPGRFDRRGRLHVCYNTVQKSDISWIY